MPSPYPRPTARQLASLWENRLADEARAKTPSPLLTTPTTPTTPTALTTPPPKAPTSPSSFQRPRKRISGSKPPMPPALAPNPITPTREEVKLTHAMVDAISPVSSFHSSTPSSPSAPTSPLPPALAAQVEQLSRTLSECDRRMDNLEIQFREISSRMTQLRMHRER
ncbi:hypothetical protein BWQ96_01892 [Gracilariopsis chorda]|uniref:Uncharacterized protein n=1 Tax=Gracilariopsis chorda TaxID=448386 RepID=A0A2V3J2U7_9FLOR|nr:hypothetical protein BWQ96_01892 [Gracilariopsis chorda]|eukprot:PXF48432.1 hypothetical protein BWQ96_01892 [Gracilariopsis chorda]